MNKVTKFIQGDVIMLKVDSLPPNAQKIEIEERLGRLVLQESEVTGHFHHFEPDADVEMYQDMDFVPTNKTLTPDKGRYLVINAKVGNLYHGKGYDEVPVDNGTGDHNVMPTPGGIYKIRIVQVWDYAANESVQVRD